MTSIEALDGRGAGGEGVCVYKPIGSAVVGGVSMMLFPSCEVPGESVESDMNALNGKGVLLDMLGVGFWFEKP